jgi:hypothetical protein
MPEPFLHLKAQKQSQIYRALAPQLARSPVVLEKDVWVCWVLQTLFTMPDRLPMAFKGGTSLSKVFGAIARFSEDVDITLDYRGLDGSFDPFAKGATMLTVLWRRTSKGRCRPSLTPTPMRSGSNSVRTASSCACITQVCWKRQGTIWATVF